MKGLELMLTLVHIEVVREVMDMVGEVMDMVWDFVGMVGEVIDMNGVREIFTSSLIHKCAHSILQSLNVRLVELHSQY